MTMIAGEDSGSGSADFWAALSRPLAIRRSSFSSFVRTRSIALMRCVRSNARRSSEWTTNTRTPDWFEATSWTSVFGGVDFSRAVMPTGHSIQGPVAL